MGWGPLSLLHGSAEKGSPRGGPGSAGSELAAFIYFFNCRLGAVCGVRMLLYWVVLDQGLAEGLGSLTAWVKEMTSGAVDTHPIG